MALNCQFYLKKNFKLLKTLFKALILKGKDVNMNIMVVEDNLKTGTALLKGLQSCGFEVVIAPSAEEAWDLLEKGSKCDLLILDFHLPGAQGPEFYRQLGMNKKYRDIPIIPFTSQIESNSPNSDALMREYAMSKTVVDEVPSLLNRNTSHVVSKGNSDTVENLPASLYVAIAEMLRQKGVPFSQQFKVQMRTALETISVNKEAK